MMLEQLPAVYILANRESGSLHSGVAANLRQHLHDYRQALGEIRKEVFELVYFELFEDLEQAYMREKQIQEYSHRRKTALIDSINPRWDDLYQTGEEA